MIKLHKEKLKRERTRKPVNFTLSIWTIKRLENEVERGAWSYYVDRAINEFLDKERNL